jgi:two-component system phosphate regulon sensor histidine kinase PhoR
VPTGNVHDVKGFGLGLSYVKAITLMKGWDIKVKSKLGEGSTFILIINKEDKDE